MREARLSSFLLDCCDYWVIPVKDRTLDMWEILLLTLSRGGWHTTRLTLSRQFLTSCITWSLGALATSSPLMLRIWSPGMSLSTLGPPPVTNLTIIELLMWTGNWETLPTSNLSNSIFTALSNSSHLTMTGFSEPATNPNPSSGCLSSVTSLGSGTSSESVAPHFLGSS